MQIACVSRRHLHLLHTCNTCRTYFDSQICRCNRKFELDVFIIRMKLHDLPLEEACLAFTLYLLHEPLILVRAYSKMTYLIFIRLQKTFYLLAFLCLPMSIVKHWVVFTFSMISFALLGAVFTLDSADTQTTLWFHIQSCAKSSGQFEKVGDSVPNFISSRSYVSNVLKKRTKTFYKRWSIIIT